MINGLPSPTTGRQEATLHVLNALGDAAYDLRFADASQLWGFVKDENYFWTMVERTMRTRGSDSPRGGPMRLAAVFCAAGIRPGPDVHLSEDTRNLLEKIVFVVVLLRSLRNSGALRMMEIRSYWEIESIVSTYIRRLRYARLSKEAQADVGDLIARALIDMVSCRRGHIDRIYGLTGALRAWHLLPKDLGLTAAQVDSWYHAQLIVEVNKFHEACFPNGNDRTLYVNAKGLLVPLTRGVRIEETNLTREELETMRVRLTAYVLETQHEPSQSNLRPPAMEYFRRDVMPLFGKIPGMPVA